MPRPRSDEKRMAIFEAATCVVVKEGLSATTAAIAKEAGIANGSLFTYFETKTELFNQLYIELKRELASAALNRYPEHADLKAQLFHVWRNWSEWAVEQPHKRKALAQLTVSEEITQESRTVGSKAMSPVFDVVERCRAKGGLSKVPSQFAGALINAAAEATMDYMTQDPLNAKKHCKSGFDAMWRMLE